MSAQTLNEKKTKKRKTLSYQISIPERIIEDKEITDASIRLFLFIAKAGNRRGYIWHSNERLAEALGMHERAISKLLLKLETNGYISRFNNVKPSKLYEKKQTRVIWLRDAYLIKKDEIKNEAKKQMTIAKFIRERRSHHKETATSIPVWIGDNYHLIINDRGRMVDLLNKGKEVDKDLEHNVWSLYYEITMAQKEA